MPNNNSVCLTTEPVLTGVVTYLMESNPACVKPILLHGKQYYACSENTLFTHVTNQPIMVVYSDYNIGTLHSSSTAIILILLLLIIIIGLINITIITIIQISALQLSLRHVHIHVLLFNDFVFEYLLCTTEF